MTHRPVCVKCKVEFHPEKNGFKVVDMFQSNHQPKPFQIWDSDKWKCPICGFEVAIGFGNRPLATADLDDDFTNKVIQVVDKEDHCVSFRFYK